MLEVWTAGVGPSSVGPSIPKLGFKLGFKVKGGFRV